jgi:cbb3-type cytochrome oxidase maturation protein
MSVLFVVVPVALVVVLAAVGAYLWAARRGQFDDLTTPAIRALHDDDPPPRRGGKGPPPEDRPGETPV